MKEKKLEDLLKNVQLTDQQEIEEMLIRKITYDSRKTEPMTLFVAIKGYATDGHRFLGEAFEKGAVAAVVETKEQDIPLNQYRVPDSRLALARIAAQFYQPELSQMLIVGITGTNGKTTTSFLIQSILNAAKKPSGLIGTIHYDIAGECKQAWNTTPESSDLYEMIYQMKISGQQACVLEASSHGLALNRLDSLGIDVAVFTNLSQDHLDFHGDFETYYRAKKRLFTNLKPQGVAVINRDDKYGLRLLHEIDKKVLDFGTSPQSGITVKDWTSSLNGITAHIQTPDTLIDIHSGLIGKFNLENILAAVAACSALQIEADDIRQGIANLKNVPGRLESVNTSHIGTIIVDYSHTPDALEKALKVLSELTDKKVWVVFGCGGDRDQLKRPLMGRVADLYADKIILTSDNPRSEDPDKIIAQIYQGIENKDKVIIDSDRRKAIKRALEGAGADDTILVAGKGHENYQEINGIKYPFDDRLVIKELDQ